MTAENPYTPPTISKTNTTLRPSLIKAKGQSIAATASGTPTMTMMPTQISFSQVGEFGLGGGTRIGNMVSAEEIDRQQA